MTDRVKQYPSKRLTKKKGVRVTGTNNPRKMHDPMKELTKLFKGMHSGGRGGGGGGVGVGRWHKDPKTGRRTWKVL